MKSILESAGGKLLAKQPSYRKIMEHKQNKVLVQCQVSVTKMFLIFHHLMVYSALMHVYDGDAVQC